MSTDNGVSYAFLLPELATSSDTATVVVGELDRDLNTMHQSFFDTSRPSEPNPHLKRAGRVCKLAGLALALMLACAPPVHAQPRDGSFGGGSAVANPFPDRCPDPLAFDDIPLGDPLVTVSFGPTVTPADIASFNAKWMRRDDRNAFLGDRAAIAAGVVGDNLHGYLYKQRPGAMAWDVGPRAEAMVRMFELTGDMRYLDHLRELAETALMYRDDKHLGPVPGDGLLARRRPLRLPMDHFYRQAGMPAWGERGLVTAGFHHIQEISSAYAYGPAAFARIVAENPNLQGPYGECAVRYANETIKTVQAFLFTQVEYRPAGGFIEATLISPAAFRVDALRPTTAQCNTAFQDAVADGERTDLRWRDHCHRLRYSAGIDLPHNINQLFLMVPIELWRVLDSPWYRNRPDASPEAGQLRTLLPLLVSRFHRYFLKRLKTIGSGATARYVWNYNDGLAGSGIDTRTEDVSHGAVDMRGIEMLRASLPRLDQAARPAGEPIILKENHLRLFANTFLQKIATGTNLAEDVNGRAASPADRRNITCDGWVNLAVVDARVYGKCREIMLRAIDGEQRYLSILGHAALLTNKRWLPEPGQGPAPPAPRCEVLCAREFNACRLGGEVNIQVCVQRRTACRAECAR